VPKPLPTPLSTVYSLTYLVTQNYYDGTNRATSTFYENYTLNFLDNYALNVTATINYTFYRTDCINPYQYLWYMDYIVDSPSRLINETIAYPTSLGMNYLGTHLRLYADASVAVGGSMLSNNFELGYGWGNQIQPMPDITMTRLADSIYSIGVVAYDALVFQGTLSETNAGILSLNTSSPNDQAINSTPRTS
jgi:hypothetical protein